MDGLPPDVAIKQLKLLKAKVKFDAANEQLEYERMRQRPSMFMGTTIRRDGSRWLCIVETADEFLDCPMAYGDSPNEAMINFDQMWTGKGLVLEEHEDEEDYEEEY